MKILSIDHGTKRIGLAISDELGISVKALPVLHVKNSRQSIDLVLKIISLQKCEMLLIGLPVGFDNYDSPQAVIVANFAKELKEKTEVPIKFWDESYSSIRVGQKPTKKSKRHIDSEAAKIILEEYLESNTSQI
jgi:putative Holliday junction resolvase